MQVPGFELPDWAVAAVAPTPEEFLPKLRLAAAMFWHARSDVSQGVAAAIAGLDRTEFILALGRHEQDIFVVDFDDLDAELARVRAARQTGLTGDA